ncbi:hypothetical protein GCM10028803_42120 [Larkinella knui]|uniref:Secretion system C-terminal sorting domain-containing protein n=1 Tax=Larkinella knui TaxID=2025310 RepID=A0A3P1CND6_9BACT|nr:hypothetical protein [Larkinella knui]RRB14841.1 hypothetical protein EHT87_09750 [Larkinella knui]
MLNLLSNLICTALLSAPLSGDPAAPKALPFEVGTYVTSENKIRVSIEKSAPESVVLLLRNDKKEILFREVISKKQLKYAAKLDMKNLTDGTYELEFKSAQGAIRKQVNVVTQPVTTPERMVVMNTPVD